MTAPGRPTSPPPHGTLAAALHRAYERWGGTQVALAAAMTERRRDLDLAGASSATDVSRVFSGRHEPSPVTVGLMAAAMGYRLRVEGVDGVLKLEGAEEWRSSPLLALLEAAAREGRVARVVLEPVGGGEAVEWRPTPVAENGGA